MIALSIIGGSNSVLRNGYSAKIGAYMHQTHGVEIASIENAAVGGTSILSGLAAMAKSRLHTRSQVLVIEYTLNDSASFGRRPDLLDHWAQAYEGAIRMALAANPGIVIVPLILGRRGGPHRRGFCWISMAVRQMAHHYGLQVADVTSELVKLSQDDLGSYYADESHLSEGAGVPLIVQVLGDAIASGLVSRTPNRLPSAIYSNNFAHAKYVDLTADYFGAPPAAKTYRNSVFERETRVLGQGNEIRFSISGRCLLLDYVSTRSSGTLRVSTAHGEFFQNTARATFLSGGYKFLIGTLVPEVHGRFSIKGMRSEVRIALTDEKADTDQIEDEAAAPLVPAINSGPTEFAVSGMLVCGVTSPRSASSSAAA